MNVLRGQRLVRTENAEGGSPVDTSTPYLGVAEENIVTFSIDWKESFKMRKTKILTKVKR